MNKGRNQNNVAKQEVTLIKIKNKTKQNEEKLFIKY